MINKKKMAILLVFCIISTIFSFSVSAASGDTFNYVQNGCDGATIACSSDISYVLIDDTTLVKPYIDGGSVLLKRVDSAVGVATVTVVSENASIVYEVPVGYTTFIFDGNRVTVYPGIDTNYEITGINELDEEYAPTAMVDDNGNAYYENADNYKLSVEIKKKGGTYVFAGESDDMSIVVKKEATADATLLLCGIELSSSFTSPVTIKKDSSATVTISALRGHENTFSDAEYNNADNYSENLLAESAVIKAKSYANLTLDGNGTLNLICNSKNAVKVGEYGALTIEELTLNVNSSKNGISSDNTMVINSGTINVTSAADAIRTDPDVVDADAGCSGIITINGGNINISAGTDGIQSAQDLIINGGNFDIETCNGYNDSSFDGDTSSAKGLKASFSSDDESSETAEETATNMIKIYGGTFSLNTADDAIHSDAYIVIEGGRFNIYTGDDAVHADTSLDLGAENAADCGVQMYIHSCYEGLEAGNVYVYSGVYDITASDDGINAAGGSDNTDNTGTGFNPGGGSMGGSNRPGSGSSGSSSSVGTSTADYSINIYGGLISINASGDGIDSNQNLNITGGTQVVWGGNSSENPLDFDGSLYIKGGTTFAAGYNQMSVSSPASGSQSYKTYNSNISSGKTVLVTVSNSTVVSLTVPKSIGYVFYSSPDVTSSNCSVSSSSSAASNLPATTASHNPEESMEIEAGCISNGITLTTCTECGAVEASEISETGHVYDLAYEKYSGSMHSSNCPDCNNTIFALCSDSETSGNCDVCGGEISEDIIEEDTSEEEVYTVSFKTDGHCSIDIYYTQDYTTANEINVTETIARNSSTGVSDISGSGQANFLVVVDSGYEIESVTAEGDYKNLKDVSDTGVENMYRLTKITGDVEVTVITKKAKNVLTFISGPELKNKSVEGTVECSFLNNENHTVTGVARAALYDASGKLIKISSSEEVTALEGETAPVSVIVDWDDLNDTEYKLKIFFWKNNVGLMPLVECCVVEY